MERMKASGLKKRFTTSEGGSLRKGKLIGVKGIILLAVVPNIKETHKNLSIIFNLIHLNINHSR